jgi:menaquinone-dependent protoporphyrinogen oxidase
MRSAAIIYCTRHGQTEKIAYRMRDHLVGKGVAVQLFTADDAPATLDPRFDTVIIGGPIYLGKYAPALVNWVRTHKEELDRRLTGFFSVSLNAADSNISCRLVDSHLLSKFMRETRWRPTFAASFAGALKYSRYNWVLRKLMQWKSRSAHGPVDTAKDYEFTDWPKVISFVDCLLGSLEAQAFEHQFRAHL